MSFSTGFSYARQDVVAVGKFSLNISKVPEKLSMHLYSLIQQLVTKVRSYTCSAMQSQ